MRLSIASLASNGHPPLVSCKHIGESHDIFTFKSFCVLHVFKVDECRPLEQCSSIGICRGSAVAHIAISRRRMVPV